MTRSPGVALTGDHWVEAVEEGSRVTLSLKFQGALGGLVARLLHDLNYRYLGLEAAGLKQRSEAL